MTSTSDATINNVEAPFVAVIGAGVAGLKASQMLLENGYRVALFEARDRIGGRICSSERLGKPVDLGPNWVHGTDHNPIIPLAQLSNSVLHEFGHLCPVIDPNGELLDDKEAQDLGGLMWRIIEEATEYSKEHQDEIPKEKSLYDYTIERAEKLFCPAQRMDPNTPQKATIEVNGAVRLPTVRTDSGRIRWKGKESRRKELWLSMLHMWGSFIGSSVTQQSLKFFFLEEPVEGPNLFVASTYGPILQTLATPVVKAGVIHLSTPIRSIKTPSEPTGKPVITTVKGTEVTADAVISTIPLGCLKKSAISFEPQLPERIQTAISSLSYGNLEKVYIRFPKAFWGKESPPFFTFLSPNYAPKTNPKKWHMCCFSLAHLPEPHDQPTLLFYVFGDISAHLTGTFPAFDTDEGLKRYSEFFEPYFSRIGGFDPEDPDCKPVDVVATAWSSDEYAGFGSYSNFQVGLENGEEDIKALREGLPERRLWFAGEHTSPILGLGSVSGAYWSGEGAAEQVMKSLGLGGAQERRELVHGMAGLAVAN